MSYSVDILAASDEDRAGQGFGKQWERDLARVRQIEKNGDVAAHGFGKRLENGEIERAVEPGKPQIKDSNDGIGDPYRAVDTIRRMWLQKVINDDMYQAGRQFRNDFAVAGLHAIHACDPSKIPGQYSPPHISESRIAAKAAIKEAVQLLGGMSSPGGACLWHVVGLEESLKEWAIREGWCGRPLDPRAAGGILVGALGTIACDWLPKRLKDVVVAA